MWSGHSNKTELKLQQRQSMYMCEIERAPQTQDSFFDTAQKASRRRQWLVIFLPQQSRDFEFGNHFKKAKFCSNKTVQKQKKPSKIYSCCHVRGWRYIVDTSKPIAKMSLTLHPQSSPLTLLFSPLSKVGNSRVAAAAAAALLHTHRFYFLHTLFEHTWWWWLW